MKKDTDITYEEALGQLEKLVAKIEDPGSKLDTMTSDIEKALELVKLCKSKLRALETKIGELND